MNAEQFIREYWQQKPVLLRQFVPGFVDPMDGDELAGLACEELAESRLVIQQNGGWALTQGPFDEQDFKQLPERNWTLLVQAVDLWDPGVAALKDSFDFLPAWRIEDIMVSYAEDGGGVGPHFDFYDVFLLQGAGRRRWRIGQKCSSTAAQSKASGLRLLQDFQQTEEFILETGDVLYIPPQFAHWGESLGDSLCYSLGFRSPSMAEMLLGFSDSLAGESDEANRFVDPAADQGRAGGEISLDSLNAAHRQLQSEIANAVSFARWFGCNATAPKYPELLTDAEPQLSPEEFEVALGCAKMLKKSAAARFAYTHCGKSILLFLDGRSISLPSSMLDFVVLLCETRQDLYTRELSASLRTPEEDACGREILTDLCNSGSLFFDDYS